MDEPAIRVERLTRRFGSVVAVREVSFDVTDLGGTASVLLNSRLQSSAGRKREKSQLFSATGGGTERISTDFGCLRLSGDTTPTQSSPSLK